MKFSIIIPFRRWDSYLEECIEGCLKQEFKDYEIILLPDEEINKKFKKTKIIATGKVRPSVKRNLGVKKSRGEIIAFVDSDASPKDDWLLNSLKYFENKEIGAVGGPNLTPENVNFYEKLSGDILSSFLFGTGRIRYKICRNRMVEELPSCNLMVRRDVFSKLNGFDETLLTAEDSKLCFEVKEKLGLKVYYASDVIVYHHRRDNFKGHLRQMGIYGRDVAWLLKENFKLWKLYYAIPGLFVLGLVVGGGLSFIHLIFKRIYFGVLGLYLVMLLFGTPFNSRYIFTLAGMFLTHLAYGLGFWYGLFSKRKDVLNVR